MNLKRQCTGRIVSAQGVLQLLPLNQQAYYKKKKSGKVGILICDANMMQTALRGV